MTPTDITTAKSRAIHFFGYEKYEELKLRSADYFAEHGIKIDRIEIATEMAKAAALAASQSAAAAALASSEAAKAAALVSVNSEKAVALASSNGNHRYSDPDKSFSWSTIWGTLVEAPKLWHLLVVIASLVLAIRR